MACEVLLLTSFAIILETSYCSTVWTFVVRKSIDWCPAAPAAAASAVRYCRSVSSTLCAFVMCDQLAAAGEGSHMVNERTPSSVLLPLTHAAFRQPYLPFTTAPPPPHIPDLDDRT